MPLQLRKLFASVNKALRKSTKDLFSFPNVEEEYYFETDISNFRERHDTSCVQIKTFGSTYERLSVETWQFYLLHKLTAVHAENMQDRRVHKRSLLTPYSIHCCITYSNFL